MVGPYRTRAARAVVLALITAGLLASGCGGDKPGTLNDISSVQDLKDRFNRDAGKPRVVLLLSPT